MPPSDVGPEAGRVEHPHVGATDARRGELRIAGPVLAAMRRRDEGAACRRGPAKTMSRGSSPTSSVRTTRGGVAPTSTMLTLSERWFTTHTSPFDARRDGDRLEADRDRALVRQLARSRIDGEDLELVVGRVDREQAAAVGAQRQRPNVAALEGGEGCQDAVRGEHDGGDGQDHDSESAHRAPPG